LKQDTNYDDLHAELTERVEKNLTDYHNSLMGFGKRELINMAGKISTMSDAHSYMTVYHDFSEEELRFYLQFQNPLEVVANTWRDLNIDLSDMSIAMDYVFERRSELTTEYPLICDGDVSADTSLRRFMGVDIIDFLGKIAEKVILYYPNDWNIDKEILYNAADSDNIEDSRFIWHICSCGTHINKERDVFIKDSGAFEYMTDYRQNDPDMFGYYIEVMVRDGQSIWGNVFEVGNYAEFAKHIRETALPLDSVSLTYSGSRGINARKTVRVSRREYDNDRNRLMCESGNVTAVRWHPANENELTELLRRERSIRMSYPIGSQQVHLKKLTEKLAEIRRLPEQTVVKKKQTLEERLKEAGRKVKAQNINNSTNSKSRKREERQ